MTLFSRLKTYVASLPSEVEPPRAQVLLHLRDFIAGKRKAGQPVSLVFICTHNSRRSHLAQIWATIAATYYGIAVSTYSGGTEVTAFNPRAVSALERAGLVASKPMGDNPKYIVHFSDDAPAIECYSKRYDDPRIPSTGFGAVMTCDDADQNCPFIPGATRIPIKYVDPKYSDGTPDEERVYDERTKQIATEMFFVFRSVRG